MRPPPAVLAVDAAILISALIGRSAGALLDVGRYVRLATTDRAMIEVTRRVGLGLNRPDLLGPLDVLVADFDVVAVETLGPLVEAAITLREAVASRNGSANDAHILALAWELNAEIWSHDRDFAGTGVATWSTVNLVRVVTLTESGMEPTS
ncbi:MAG TPA: PIN domain-containing protein [Caulobacteraceae bacterium]